MEYQIILLPATDYWSWVRASSDYVMTYGPNLTSDPGTAGRYMAPRQVVTFVNLPGGYAEAQDMTAWFQKEFPGVRLDTIDAQTPDALHAEFGRRLEAHDRYGQKRRPFFLLWPTDYPVITQRFGANPQIYSRFGVPAHEGIDFRALTNTNVYCCFDGVVYEVHLNPNDHPYGIHVRIRHRDGYKTVYAHLERPLVRLDDTVKGGQVIGKADSTGASSGAHLHVTLKRDGATGRGETTYPKDIIDPTPFMVWPEGRLQKSAQPKGWAAQQTLVGVHGRVGATLGEADLAAIAASKVEAIKVDARETESTIARLHAINPRALVVARLTSDFSRGAIAATDFVAAMEDDLRRLATAGVRYFEIHANPNLQSGGWLRSWRNGSEFGGWFAEVIAGLRQRLPEGQYGFPGLASGEVLAGLRGDSRQFLEDAETAALAADWIGVNCFWTDTAGMQSPSGGREFEDVRRLFPDRLLFVTEFGNASDSMSSSARGQQYVDYYRMLRDASGIGAAFAFALSAETGHEALRWIDEHGQGEIASIVGGRGF
jgi:murein DD-endopeptidase MepM/ murein hydrolase activator NlpD